MSAGPLNVRLKCASWAHLQHIYQLDLSRGAIFLKASKPPPIGTAVRISLTLPSESSVVLVGHCHQHVDHGELDGRGPGVDVRLSSIPQSAMWLIESALKAAGAAAATSAPPAEAANVKDAGLDDGAPLASAETDLVAALSAELRSLRKLNPFQILGVDRNSDDAAVRAAFGALTKRYHPDRFARYDSTAVRNVAAEIFILIRDAYRRVVDLDARKATANKLDGNKSSSGISGNVIVAAPSDSQARRTEDLASPRPSATRPAPPPPPVPPRTAASAAPPSHDSGGTEIDRLLDAGQFEEALQIYRGAVFRRPDDRGLRTTMTLIEALRALAEGDRMTAAEHLETVLEADPDNARATVALAEIRRRATEERRGHMARLLGKSG